MKKYVLLILATATLSACGENKKDTKSKEGLLSTDLVNNPYSANGVDTSSMGSLPTMDFVDTLHNFGWIEEGGRAVYSFEFKNNGKTPLVVSGANGSCGCAVASFPKEPIPPGGSGKIDVEFNSAEKMGHQEKSVSVTANSNRGVHVLYIKADIKSK